MSIFDDLVSKDTTRIWSGACAVRRLRDRGELAMLAEHIDEIKNATQGIALGGALRPNSSHLAFAIMKLEQVRGTQECLCSLYALDDQYNPSTEETDGNVQILETTLIEDKWADFYTCRCTQCDARYRVEEREYHYTWWAWKRA